MYKGLHVRYLILLSDVNETLIFFLQLCEQHSNIKFHENTFDGGGGGEYFHADGRTGVIKLIVPFQNFPNSSKIMMTIVKHF